MMTSTVYKSVRRGDKRSSQISGTDVVLENGTAVYVSLYGLQGDDNYFNDPLTFDPDRFKDAMPEAYLPFGTVDSQCVGNN